MVPAADRGINTCMLDNLPATILAVGALGTAAFGIVEGLKRWSVIGDAGFGTIMRILGPILAALRGAYGPDAEALLRAQYRGDSQELGRLVRQGARLGLSAENAEELAASLDVVPGAALRDAAAAVVAGSDLTPEQRNVIGRFEIAVDARIEAATTLAQAQYSGTMKIAASIVAIALALLVGWRLCVDLLHALVVGLAAVPLAPIAKDVAAGLRAAAQAMGRR